MVAQAQETFTSLLEPFILDKMYPAVEEEVAPGKWVPKHTIQPHQKKLHDRVTRSGLPANRILFSGGVGNGKSHCMAVEMYRLLRTYPRIKIVVVTAYDYYFSQFILPTWYKVLPEDSPHIKRYNRKDRIITLTNGSQIAFRAYDDPDKIRGWDAHVIWIEEAAELGDGNNEKAYQIWLNLNMRLRSNDPRGYPLIMYVSQNPKGHNWVWKVFVRSEPGVADQPLGDDGYKTIFGKTADGKDRAYKEWEKVEKASGNVFYTISTGSSANVYNPVGYVASMLGQMADNPAVRQRMVEGDFNLVNTLVYDAPVYSERTHLISYSHFLDYWEIGDIPSWWRVVVGIDCGGQRSPWAIEYYAQTEDGSWVCFDEIYKMGLTWGEIAELILEKNPPDEYGRPRFENIQYWIDPISSNQKQGPTSDTIKEEFARRGIGTNMPKHYNKTGGIMRVQSFMKRNMAQPCPYKPDVLLEDAEGNHAYDIGHSQLYYLTGMPHKRSDINPLGHACPANIAEKQVYRYDTQREMAVKDAEEGLTPVLSEKLVDRDDHAQTAEMFFALGIAPLQMPGKAPRSRQAVDPTRPPPMYGRQARRRAV